MASFYVVFRKMVHKSNDESNEGKGENNDEYQFKKYTTPRSRNGVLQDS